MIRNSFDLGWLQVQNVGNLVQAQEGTGGASRCSLGTGSVVTLLIREGNHQVGRMEEQSLTLDERAAWSLTCSVHPFPPC